jgi:hypothetical protein
MIKHLFWVCALWTLVFMNFFCFPSLTEGLFSYCYSKFLLDSLKFLTCHSIIKLLVCEHNWFRTCSLFFLIRPYSSVISSNLGFTKCSGSPWDYSSVELGCIGCSYKLQNSDILVFHSYIRNGPNCRSLHRKPLVICCAYFSIFNPSTVIHFEWNARLCL